MKALCLLLIVLFFSASSQAQVTMSKQTRVFDIPPEWTSQAAGSQGQLASDGDDPGYGYSDSSAAADAPHSSALAGVQANERTKRQPEIQWVPAMSQALLSTGIMHTFNLWTEAGTRDALYGPWF